MKRALFLDRDGVVNKEKNHIYKIEDFEFINGVFETCRYFQMKNYSIIIITNQSGIARGKYTENQYQTLTNWMIKEFEKKHVKISKVYHCPHHPDFSGTCNCRKPKPKMIFDAKKEFDIDVPNSILVGDKNTDIELALNAGITKCYLIKTGHKIEKNIFNVEILDNMINLKCKY